MLRKVMLGFAITLLVSCQEEAEEPSVSIVGDWEVSIFQVLSIEGAEVLDDRTFVDAGLFSLHEGGTGTIQFRTIDPWGFTSSNILWAREGSELILSVEALGEHEFDLSITNEDRLALTEMVTEEETDQRPHKFDMTTIQLSRLQ